MKKQDNKYVVLTIILLLPCYVDLPDIYIYILCVCVSDPGGGEEAGQQVCGVDVHLRGLHGWRPARCCRHLCCAQARTLQGKAGPAVCNWTRNGGVQRLSGLWANVDG